MLLMGSSAYNGEGLPEEIVEVLTEALDGRSARIPLIILDP
jgi:hypothetical protein